MPTSLLSSFRFFPGSQVVKKDRQARAIDQPDQQIKVHSDERRNGDGFFNLDRGRTKLLPGDDKKQAAQNLKPGTGLSELVSPLLTRANSQAADINREGREKVIAAGSAEVVILNAAELAAWQNAMRPVWNQFSDVIGADLIAAAEAMGKTP